MRKDLQKYKITHINTHDNVGGAAKVAWRLMETQNKIGHYSRILAAFKGDKAELSEAILPELDTLPQSEFKLKGYLYYEYQGSHNLVNHQLVKNSNIVHLHNLHGDYFNPFSMLFLSKKNNLVWTLHDMQAITGHCAHSFECNKWEIGCGGCPSLNIPPEIIKDSTRKLLKDKEFIYNNSEFIVTVPSTWLKTKVEKSVLKNHRCELIYNGVDTGSF